MAEIEQKKKWDYKAISLGVVIALAVLYNFIGFQYTLIIGIVIFIILLLKYFRDKSKEKK
jgi:hypothetical protein